MSELDETFGCKQCSHQAVWPFQLDHHIQRNHRNTYANVPFRAVEEPELYSCIRCGSKSYCKLSQYEHWVNCHINARNLEDDIKTGQFYERFERNWACDNCKHEGHSSISLCKHLDSCEVTPEAPMASPPALKPNTKFNKHFNYCAKCSYKSVCKGNLKRHLVVHARPEEINWYDCTECSYQAKQKANLNKHMLTHGTDKAISLFNCAECLYQTKRKSGLTRHMVNTHARADEIHWFQCASCPYRAKRKASLKVHVRSIHAGDDAINWFYCDKCFYRGKTKSALKRHLRTHAGAKKFDPALARNRVAHRPENFC